MLVRNIVGFASCCLVIFVCEGNQTNLRAAEPQVHIPRQTINERTTPPKWDKGFLLIRYLEPPSGEPDFLVIDRQGTLVMRVDVEFPDSISTRVLDLATAGSDGSVVASTLSIGTNGVSAATLSFVNKKGVVERVVRTNPTALQHLTVARDGSIWGMGFDIEKGNGNPEAEVFWRFDRSGSVRAKYLARKEFATDNKLHPTMIAPTGRPALVSSGSLVAGYLPDSQEWVEFGLDGKLLNRYKIKLPAPEARNGIPGAISVGGVAVTNSGSAYASIMGDGISGLYELDRNGPAWIKSVQKVPGFGLFGSIENQLIFNCNASDAVAFCFGDIEARFPAFSTD